MKTDWTIIAVCCTSMFLASCGQPATTSSANLSSDPMTLKPAVRGKTTFTCSAQVTQTWVERNLKSLDIKSDEVSSTLEEAKAFSADASIFTNDRKENIADGPNINAFRIHAFFVDESNLGCDAGLWDLQVTTTTTNAHLPRNTTTSTNYCWDPRGRGIKISQRVLFGPERKGVGQRESQEVDLSTADLTDLQATPVKYSFTCTR